MWDSQDDLEGTIGTDLDILVATARLPIMPAASVVGLGLLGLALVAAGAWGLLKTPVKK